MGKVQRYLIKFSVVSLLLIAISCENENCESHEATVYLNTAVEMMQNAKLKLLEALKDKKDDCNPVDCFDLYKMGNRKSGEYSIWPMSRVRDNKPLKVFCDMETDGGGWTVIQRRGDFGNPNDYFNRSWAVYKSGFGSIDADFWLGNDNIFALTQQRLSTIRFDLEDRQRIKAFAKYNTFWIDDEYNKYTLHISGFSGNAGDGMLIHNEMKFTTSDQDNDRNPRGNCGVTYKSGWWFNNCYDGYSSLNGPYNVETNGGIDWMPFRWEVSLRWTEMKIRPHS